MNNITAKLVAARRVQCSFGECVTGDVFGDTKGRFQSGDRIRTSPIVLIENNIVYTENSIYEVTWSETI